MTENSRPRLGVVDDFLVSGRGVSAVLTEAGQFESGSIANSVENFLEIEQASVRNSDVVLLDLELRNGTSVDQNISVLHDHGYVVVIYTQENRPALLQLALRAGADALISKADLEDSSLETILAALERDGAHLSKLMSQVMEATSGFAPSLSPRQRQVLGLHAAGVSGQLISKRIGIAPDTVQTHIRDIKARYAALGFTVGTKADMLKRGLLDGHIQHDWYLENDDEL